jgi:hypothetical protein
MSNTVLLKKSSVGAKVPLTTDLTYGELALNYADGKLYFKDSSNNIQSFASLTATATLTNKTLTSPALTTPSITGLTTITVTTSANALSVTYTPGSTSGAAILATGKESQGGVGYFDFLKVTNTTSGGTNGSKSFRLNSTGVIEIINSAYSANIFSLTDAGVLTVPQISAGGSVGTNGQVLASTGTGLQWINASGTGTVTSIIAGTGLSGGTITTNGTISLTYTSVTIGSTSVSLGSTITSIGGLDILTATGTSHWVLPVGTTAQRPGTPATGMIRYNSSISSFEGYSSGAWASLGGVKSVDGYTYIIAETSAGASNGDLDFYAEAASGTAATQVGQWNRTNLKDYTGTLVGTQTTQNLFNTVATTVNFAGAATALSLGASTGTTTVNNNLSVTGTSSHTGNSTFSGTLGVTGATTLSSALTYGGVTLSNSVTGTGSMVLSASPTFTGTANFAALSTSGNATVGGTLGVTGATTLSSTLAVTSTSTFTGKATFNGGADIVDSIAYDYNFTGTTSSTTATAMTSFATATYRSGKLLMQVVNGTAYRILELLLVHDGTTVTLSENYANANEIQTGATNTTFSATIATGTLTVYATASSGTSVIKGHATLFKV